MILYDFTPIWYPEYAAIGTGFLNYLKLLRVIDKISCISSDIERQTRHMIACIREESEVVIATHDLPGIIHDQSEKSIEEETRNVSTQPYILCVGTIEPRKNQHTLLQA